MVKALIGRVVAEPVCDFGGEVADRARREGDVGGAAALVAESTGTR